MEWVSGQIGEIVTSFTNFPTLTIILPELGGAKEVGSVLEALPDVVLGGSNNADVFASDSSDSTSTKSDPLTSARNTATEGLDYGINYIDEMASFLSQLPILELYPEVVSLDVPWFGRQEMEGWLVRNKIIIEQWQSEYDDLVSD